MTTPKETWVPVSPFTWEALAQSLIAKVRDDLIKKLTIAPNW